MTCLNSISPRVSRKKQVTLVSSPDKKHSTIIYVICLLLICLWFAGMVLVGGYARQLWVLWIVKAEVTVEAETPAFKQSTQHYFFKKQPLPVVESVEEEDDPGVAVENAPLFF